MNLATHGTHAAADWLNVKLSALEGRPVELIALSDGELITRPHRPNNRPPRFGTPQGIYRRGITYRDLHADLEFLRREVVA